MSYVIGFNRHQLTFFPEAIEDYIDPESPVRFLDVFVDNLDMNSIGFEHSILKETGRPPYNPKDILKLYLYGYLNRLRSSRVLERETKRNLEVIWLLKRLSPDHKTISDFRRNNSKALRGVFKEFVLLCKRLELFGTELIAIDSTKFKASNSRAKIKDRKQLANALVRIEESIIGYFDQLDYNDEQEEGGSLSKEELQQKISQLKKKKRQFEEAIKEIEKSGSKHISMTDSDCRLMKNEGRIQPSYNVHAAVDSKHSLIVDYEISQNAADNNHLASLGKSSKDSLEVEELDICADAGYYDSADIKECEDNLITAFVPVPESKISKKTGVPKPEFYHEQFIYNEDTDSYQCPVGHTMTYYTKTTKSGGRRMRIYRTVGCRDCTARDCCTTSPRGRYIYRWEHEAVVDRLKKRLEAHEKIIKKRKAIIEHVFGTIKKIWGYQSLLLRGIENISGEISLMKLTYNIRRVLNIMGTTTLIHHLL